MKANFLVPMCKVMRSMATDARPFSQWMDKQRDDLATQWLLMTGAVHMLVALFCAGWLLVDASPVLGLHPAIKPAKFGVSIAMYAWTMAIFLPALSATEPTRRRFAALLMLAMVSETVVIFGQALRGTRSHFNMEDGIGHVGWQIMGFMIAVNTASMVWLAWRASRRPLSRGDGTPLPPLLTWAWRAGLWLFLLGAASRPMLGPRLRHSIGGTDGGPGLLLTNWSTTHGDLRVSHFFSLHALQLLPLIALALLASRLSTRAQRIVMGMCVTFYGGFCVLTLLQAMRAQPFW